MMERQIEQPGRIVDLVVLDESRGGQSACVANGDGGDQFAILAACATRACKFNRGHARLRLDLGLHQIGRPASAS